MEGVLLSNILAPLVLTLVVEMIGAAVLGVRGKKNYLLIFLINVATNLSLNLLLIQLKANGVLNTGLPLIYLVLEPLVVVIEGLVYKNYLEDGRNPFLLSLILNLMSIVIGGLLWKSVF